MEPDSSPHRARPGLPRTHVYSSMGLRPQPSIGSPTRQSRSPGTPRLADRNFRPNLLIETRLRQADNAGELSGAGRAYSQALSLAKFRLTALGLRRNHKSGDHPDEESMLHFIATPRIHPGRVKLREVDAWKRLARPGSANSDQGGHGGGEGGGLFYNDLLAQADHDCGEVIRHEHINDAIAYGAHYSMIFAAGVESASGHSEPIHLPTLGSRGIDGLQRDGPEQTDDSEDVDESDADSFFQTGASMILRRGTGVEICDPRNHTNFIRDQVYRAKCSSLGVAENSGVLRVMRECVERKVCYCSLRKASFRNLYLGDRGVLALLPLLTFARKMRCLDLSGNGMRHGSTRQLCAILRDQNVLSSLLVLDLSNNPLGAACGNELLDLLLQRSGLLMLGLQKTQMAEDTRQRLLRQSLANFASAALTDMEEAAEIVRRRDNFTDVELALRAQPIEISARELLSSPRSGGGPRGLMSVLRTTMSSQTLSRRMRTGTMTSAHSDGNSVISEEGPVAFTGDA